DFGDAHVLANEVRRDQHETAYPVILDAAGVNGCDRRAVTVPDQNAAPESRRIDHARQNLAGLVMHERYRPWQFRGRRAPVAGTEEEHVTDSLPPHNAARSAAVSRNCTRPCRPRYRAAHGRARNRRDAPRESRADRPWPPGSAPSVESRPAPSRGSYAPQAAP